MVLTPVESILSKEMSFEQKLISEYLASVLFIFVGTSGIANEVLPGTKGRKSC